MAEDTGGLRATRPPVGLKPKDLIGIPWMVAFALRADGWYLRRDIIWHKPNPMPESVTDRPTGAHEYIFLMSKAERYFYNAVAVRENAVQAGRVRADRFGGSKHGAAAQWHSDGSVFTGAEKRNRRTVWTVATTPYAGAHFAVYPEALVEPCILAGSHAGDVILDPFCGSGTTGAVALRLGRSFVGCDLNPEYLKLARERIDAARLPVKARKKREQNHEAQLTFRFPTEDCE